MPHVVGREEAVTREHGTNLRIQRVELGAADRYREGEAERGRKRIVLGLHEDHDRQMAAVSVRPRLDGLQAFDEGHARRLEIDVLDVHDLEARLIELRDPRVRIFADQGEPAAPREESAPRVGEDIELDLPDSLGLELLPKRRVGVFPRLKPDADVQQRREQRGTRLDVVAVVCSEDLDLVQRDAAVLDPVAEDPKTR